MGLYPIFLSFGDLGIFIVTMYIVTRALSLSEYLCSNKKYGMKITKSPKNSHCLVIQI